MVEWAVIPRPEVGTGFFPIFGLQNYFNRGTLWRKAVDVRTPDYPYRSILVNFYNYTGLPTLSNFCPDTRFSFS